MSSEKAPDITVNTIAINCLEIWKYDWWNMWRMVHVGIHLFQVDKKKTMANVQIHHLQVTLATCYEKSVLNEEKKSYETALAEASKAWKASEAAVQPTAVSDVLAGGHHLGSSEVSVSWMESTELRYPESFQRFQR